MCLWGNALLVTEKMHNLGVKALSKKYIPVWGVVFSHGLKADQIIHDLTAPSTASMG